MPAGSALAVDREVFARAITQALEGHPNIRIIREEVTRSHPMASRSLPPVRSRQTNCRRRSAN